MDYVKANTIAYNRAIVLEQLRQTKKAIQVMRQREHKLQTMLGRTTMSLDAPDRVMDDNITKEWNEQIDM